MLSWQQGLMVTSIYCYFSLGLRAPFPTYYRNLDRCFSLVPFTLALDNNRRRGALPHRRTGRRDAVRADGDRLNAAASAVRRGKRGAESGKSVCRVGRPDGGGVGVESQHHQLTMVVGYGHDGVRAAVAL